MHAGVCRVSCIFLRLFQSSQITIQDLQCVRFISCASILKSTYNIGLYMLCLKGDMGCPFGVLYKYICSYFFWHSISENVSILIYHNFVSHISCRNVQLLPRLIFENIYNLALLSTLSGLIRIPHLQLVFLPTTM